MIFFYCANKISYRKWRTMDVGWKAR